MKEAPMKELLSALRMSQKEFVHKTGLKPNAVSQYATGARPVSERASLIIQRYFPHVNPHWLRTGEGKMFLSEDPHPAGDDLTPDERERLRLENIELRRMVADLKAEVYDLLKAREAEGRIPKAPGDDPGIVSAGY
jgi:transcriptional regulator with XRE-family HTH domain